MTIAQIDEILTGTFADDADRQYWIDKRQELIDKEQRAAENEEYLKEFSIYDR